MDGIWNMPPEVRRYIEKLEKENQELKTIVLNFEKRESEFKEKINELEKRLRIYENPHTPSSKQRFKGNKPNRNSSSKKSHRGAPKGHKGATRKTPEPDEIIPVPVDHCPGCGGDPGEAEGFETIITEELPPPREIKVIQYELFKYKCQHCGLEFTAKHKGCPQKGNFGVHLLSHIMVVGR